MAVKIRLQRRGRTHYSEFAIVAADSRAPRDGKFIEKLGRYNPNTNPATIDLEFDRALYWIQNGAQPTDTARAILSYKGVLMMDHLLRGVKKGSFDEEEAKNRFNSWKEQKEAKIKAKRVKISDENKAKKDKALEAEKEINEKRAKKLNERLAQEATEVATTNEETPEKTVEEKKEEPKTENKEKVITEKKEEPKMENKEEKVITEKKEEPKTENKEEK